jgi:hypothetical protein
MIFTMTVPYDHLPGVTTDEQRVGRNSEAYCADRSLKSAEYAIARPEGCLRPSSRAMDARKRAYGYSALRCWRAGSQSLHPEVRAQRALKDESGHSELAAILRGASFGRSSG